MTLWHFARFTSQLINQRCRSDLQLVELLINSMLSKLVDPCHLVRKLCIKGLGNVSSVGGQKVSLTYCTYKSLPSGFFGSDIKECVFEKIFYLLPDSFKRCSYPLPSSSKCFLCILPGSSELSSYI